MYNCPVCLARDYLCLWRPHSVSTKFVAADQSGPRIYVHGPTVRDQALYPQTNLKARSWSMDPCDDQRSTHSRTIPGLAVESQLSYVILFDAAEAWPRLLSMQSQVGLVLPPFFSVTRCHYSFRGTGTYTFLTIIPFFSTTQLAYLRSWMFCGMCDKPI